jgi:hypothetical protein
VREEPPDRPPGEGTPGRWRPWPLVLILVGVPGALYAAVPAVPFLPLTTAQKVGLSGGLVVAAEVVFWSAALFLGRKVISRYRHFDLRGWCRRG